MATALDAVLKEDSFLKGDRNGEVEIGFLPKIFLEWIFVGLRICDLM